MRSAILAGGLLLAIGAAPARADDSSGDIDVAADRVAGVRALAVALKAAEDQAGDVRIAQFLAVLPMADADAAKLDAAYSDGLHAGCTDGVCTFDGTGSAARAPLNNDSAEFKGVDVGLKEAITATYKVVEADGKQTVSICNVTGVYFARLIFRKNLVNFQFVDDGTDAIKARYELAGADPQIHCD